ncbi:putative ABC transport system permease protein [Tamaricihabitans halophyticus]|uniref:Putative ABC transport system permease protein n=1 Tax=Tamaricihabitans halophyticus TaxID=1262583 RepID=A0A4R2QQE1_9PSEU|nr:ABC transporter permease [Tamaricihabitans halophyticus]TCP49251.1 putative ABC transport system permease protein [Tamaricihabitans halophyticus]
MVDVSHGWLPLAVVCLVFISLAALVVWRIGLLPPRRLGTAALRAVIQLGVVSAVLALALGSLPLSFAFLAVMAIVATATCASRAAAGRRGTWLCTAILAGTVPALAILLGTGAVPLAGSALVPMGGILIGGAMTATTLAARRVLAVLHDRHGEFEAALALGFAEPAAVRELVRGPAADALLPALDQTRTVGLVTLPGAFVGMLLAGAPAWQAGVVQLVVLLALLLVEALAIAVVIELVARSLLRRQMSYQ